MASKAAPRISKQRTSVVDSKKVDKSEAAYDMFTSLLNKKPEPKK